MIGLVNAIGTGQATREQHGARPTQRSGTKGEVGDPPMWVRPHEVSPSPTESTRAVRPAEFQEARPKENLPEGDQARVPDRPEQLAADRPQSTALGQALDMVA